MKRLALLALFPLVSCLPVPGLPGIGYGSPLGVATDVVGGAASALSSRIVGNVVRGIATGEINKTADFSAEQQFYLGKQSAANVVARYGSNVLPAQDPLARYVARIGTAVALAAEEKREGNDEPYPFKGYRFIVVRSNEVNAAGLPGGFVVVTTGAIAAAQSEDELACVLAHEVAHLAKGHAIAPVRAARQRENLTNVALAGTGSVVHKFFSEVVESGADFADKLGYGKEAEYAADQWGAKYAAAAGYDATALERFLGRLTGAAAQGGFMKRHPAPADRIAALEQLTPGLPHVDPAPRVARFEQSTAALRGAGGD